MRKILIFKLRAITKLFPFLEMTEVTVNISMDSVGALITYQKFTDIVLLSDLVYRKEKEALSYH